MPAAFTLATLAGVEEFAARLETRLEARLLLRSSAGSPKQAVQEPLTEEVEHAASLTAAIAAQLALPAHESDPALIQAALHCLACLAAWDNAARRALLKAGAVEQGAKNTCERLKKQVVTALDSSAYHTVNLANLFNACSPCA